MKRTTTDDIKEILKVELEKSKTILELTDLVRPKSWKEFSKMGNRKNNSDRTWNRITRTSWKHSIKVAEVLKEYGFDHIAVDLLEFKQLREELIQLRLIRIIY